MVPTNYLMKKLVFSFLIWIFMLWCSVRNWFIFK